MLTDIPTDFIFARLAWASQSIAWATAHENKNLCVQLCLKMLPPPSQPERSPTYRATRRNGPTSPNANPELTAIAKNAYPPIRA